MCAELAMGSQGDVRFQAIGVPTSQASVTTCGISDGAGLAMRGVGYVLVRSRREGSDHGNLLVIGVHWAHI